MPSKWKPKPRRGYKRWYTYGWAKHDRVLGGSVGNTLKYMKRMSMTDAIKKQAGKMPTWGLRQYWANAILLEIIRGQYK